SAPTGLTAAAGNDQVVLNWNPSTGATGYNVKRSTTNNGPYTTIGPNVNVTNFTDTAATNGSTYYYVVSALDAGGEGANSSQATVTLAPNAPTNPSAVGGAGQVALSWTPSPGAATYTIKRRTTSGSYDTTYPE